MIGRSVFICETGGIAIDRSILRTDVNTVIRKIKERLRSIPFLTTILSMGWNLTFAIINAVFSIIYKSYWYMTLSVLYLLLGFMKIQTVTVISSKRRTEADMLRHNGIAMFWFAIVLSGLMIVTIRDRHNPARDKIVMITIALYTFIIVGVTIRNVVRTRMRRSFIRIALRNISCASALVSLVSLEGAMLGTFGDPSADFSFDVQAWSGAAAFVILMYLSISMYIMSGKSYPE